MKKQARKAARPPLVADTVQTGCGITLAGKRYIVSEMSWTPSSYGSLSVNLLLSSYESIDPILYYFDPPVIKAKRKRRKAKKRKTK